MRIEDCFFLGSISRTHGKNGGLVVKLETDQPEKYYTMESVLVAMHDELIPFFISEISVLKADQIIVTFEQVNWDEAKNLLGLSLYLPLSFLPTLKGKNFYYHEVEGFAVRDEQAGDIGTVQYVLDSSAQPLFVIDRAGTEIFIPAIDEFIVAINRDERTILLNCPEGLLDVFSS